MQRSILLVIKGRTPAQATMSFMCMTFVHTRRNAKRFIVPGQQETPTKFDLRWAEIQPMQCGGTEHLEKKHAITRMLRTHCPKRTRPSNFRRTLKE